MKKGVFNQAPNKVSTHSKPMGIGRKQLLLLLAACCFFANAMAGTNGDGGIKDATRSIFFTSTMDISSGAHPSKGILDLREASLPGAALTNLGELSRKVSTTISFYIKEETTQLIPTDFTASVIISIDYGASSSSYTTITKTLTVDYKKNAGTKYNARAYYTIPDAEYVNVKITDRSGIPVIGPSSNTLDTREILFLVADMDVTRYYELASGISVSEFSVKTNAVDATVPTDIAKVQWGSTGTNGWPENKGINMLQLEWAWLEDELVDNYRDGSGNFSAELLFQQGATRVDLPFSVSGSYKIPFLYDGTGILHVRVRACNSKASGNRTDGSWFYTMPKNSSNVAVSSVGHEADLNWQVATSFAEEGKSKTVISYFDGSLRSRQTVTKDNVLETVLASETFYDYQGRPAVQILPTPNINNVIQYQKNLNIFNGQASNVKDPAEFFDLQPKNDLATYTTAYLDKTKGAANYYSNQNTLAGSSTEDRFIPDANGYPFSVTRYTPDATGRILAQSGVGEKHAMGTEQVTKYYYGTPAQVELDALFGNEVGDFSHYSKNMVKDANGQMSVSYVDMHGRTVATALAGNTPERMVTGSLTPFPLLEPLKNQVYQNQVFGNTINRNLLSDNTNRVKNNNAVESVNNLFVTVPGTSYHFTYELNTETLKLAFANCVSTSFCHDCMYDLEITIANDNGEESFPHEDPTNLSSPASDKVVYRFSNVSPSADQSCSTGVASFIGFTSNKIDLYATPLLAGSYSVRKTLTISQASLNRYRDLFKQDQKEHCFTGIYDSVKASLQALTNCAANPTSPLTCASCITDLGNETDFTNAYIATLGYSSLGSVPLNIQNEISNFYKSEKAKCEKLCENADNSISSIRQMMLADMKPFEGQYARGTAGLAINLYSSSNEMHNKYDIFSTSSSRVPNLGTAKYKYPVSPLLAAPPTSSTPKDFYYNNLNDKDASINSMGNYTLLDGKTAASFTSAFQDTWAISLLPYHPEYNKLLFVETTGVPGNIGMRETFDWVTGFSNKTTWPTVGDYLNVPGISFATAKDLFYQYCYNHPTTASAFYFGDMEHKVTSGGFGSGSGHDFSMWQIAYGDIYCKKITVPGDRDDCYDAAPKSPANAASTALPSGTGNYDTGLTPAEKAQVWTVFKASYLAERRRQVNEYINDMVPFADAGTTVDKLIDHKYFVHFPATDQQSINQGDGNNGSSNPEEVNNGLDIWPTTAGGLPINVDYNPDPATNTHFLTDYTAKCSGYAPMWKAQLLQCPAIANFVPAGGVTQETILSEIIDGYTPSGSSTHRFGLIEICAHGSSETNPDGASDRPDISTIVGQPLNFEEVIRFIYTAHGIITKAICNPYMIEWPKKMGKGPKLSKTYISASNPCGRQKFNDLKNEAVIAEVDANLYEAFNGFLLDRYHETITEGLFDHLNNYKEGSSEALPNPEPLPLIMGGCWFTPQCLACDEMNGYIDDFIAEFGDAGAALGSVYNNRPSFTNNVQFTEAEINRNILLARYINYRSGLQANWVQYFTWAAAASCNITEPEPGAAYNIICLNYQPLNVNPVFLPTDPCQHTNAMAHAIAENIYKQRMEDRLAEWERAYRAKCLSAQQLEQFSVVYTNTEYHYTLYYYDQAGNLVKTVPPQGANPNYDAVFLSDVKSNRSSYLSGAAYTDATATTPARPLTPAHSLITQYRYNTLNQVVEQSTPDAGVSHFWYDALGRLVVSQHAQQKINNAFSYTLYDDLGRITEVGELPQATGSMTDAIARSVRDEDHPTVPSALENWQHRVYPYAYATGTPRQVTCTQYDISYINGNSALLPTLDQQNLRNRVSYTAVYSSIAEVGTATPGSFSTATFYTYDIHGNVDVLLQDYGSSSNTATQNSMNAADRYKKIAYDYDLISGKVNKVSYQPGSRDQFYHRYRYDAENRLTHVETSQDDIYWEQDARYAYYKHGPLARTVLGQQQVQGMDYAYTIQGWLKGINSTAISSTSADACVAGSGVSSLEVNQRFDYGQPSTYTATQEIVFNPGFSSVDGESLVAEINATLVTCQPAAGAYYNGDMGNDGSGTSVVARDAYGFALNYFRDDYKPIAGAASNPFALLPTGMFLPKLGDGLPTGNDLFNGNIGSMMVNIPKLGEAKLYGYRYDQLNRIVGMNTYNGFNSQSNSLTSIQATEEYKERISYDANGNILTYLRNGNAARLPMDNMAYSYKAGKNQLDKVVDGAADASTGEYDKYRDIKQGQATGNYQYDAIGNLVSDASEYITGIEWTVYGKIGSIHKEEPFPGGSVKTTHITYTYDASGNRISKTVDIDGYGAPSGGSITTTWYVRDAGGNVMSVYEHANSGTSHLYQTELHLYGSSRLGIVKVDRDMQATAGDEIATFTRGNKFFELGNHLGNVMATVTDRKVQVAETLASTTVGYYLPDVVNANDYYPFGMAMPGRKFSAPNSDYRYGFNGKENDKDIGEGVQDYGMRISDNRLGRFLSVDPLSVQYPWYTPYQFSGNKPIRYVDLDGAEEHDPMRWEDEQYLSGKMSESTIRERRQARGIGCLIGLGAVGAFYGGWLAYANFWSWMPAVLYNPVVQTEIVGGIAALAGYEGPDIPSPGIAVDQTFKRTWQEVKIVKQEGKIISQEVKGTAELIMHQGSSFATNAEKSMAQKLLSEGKTVEVLAESTEKGVRTADYLINGIKTELKTISAIKKTDIDHLSNSISQTLKRSKGQASSVILDVSGQEGATREAMEKGLKRYWGQNSSIQDVRVVGNGYDQTYKKTDFIP